MNAGWKPLYKEIRYYYSIALAQARADMLVKTKCPASKCVGNTNNFVFVEIYHHSHPQRKTTYHVKCKMCGYCSAQQESPIQAIRDWNYDEKR